MTTTASESVAWDLEPLVDGEGEAGADRLLAEADRRAAAFAEQLRRQRRRARRPRPRCRHHELAELSELVGRAGTYAMLRFSVDTADPAIGALLQRVQEKGTAIETQLLFFELEWADAERRARRGAAGRRRPGHARATTCAPRAATARTCSPSPRRRSSPRSRSPAATPGRGCSRGQPARSRSTLDGEDEPVALDVALSRLMSPDRDAARRTSPSASPRRWSRRCAPAATSSTRCSPTRRPTTGCAPIPTGSRRATSPTRPPTSRSQALVEAVRDALRAPAPLVSPQGAAARHRPARRLRPHGRGRRRATRSPSSGTRPRTSCWTPSATSPTCWATAPARFFDEELDRRARPRPAKRGGAFCAYTVPSVHPYVMLNYTAQAPRRADARARARPRRARRRSPATRGVFEQHTPLTLAETASVFGETLVFARLLDAGRDAGVAAVAAGRVDRGLDRDGLPPGRDEPLRGPRPHRAARRGRADRRPLRRAVDAVAGGAAGRRRRGHRRLPDVVVLRPALHRHARATSTRTPTGSCSRCAVYGTLRRGGRGVRAQATSSCCAPAARSRPRSSARSSASTSPTPASGTRAWTSSRRQLEQAEAAAEEVLARRGVSASTYTRLRDRRSLDPAQRPRLRSAAEHQRPRVAGGPGPGPGPAPRAGSAGSVASASRSSRSSARSSSS